MPGGRASVGVDAALFNFSFPPREWPRISKEEEEEPVDTIEMQKNSTVTKKERQASKRNKQCSAGSIQDILPSIFLLEWLVGIEDHHFFAGGPGGLAFH